MPFGLVHGAKRPVGQADAVLEEREHRRHAAAVGDAGRGDGVGARDALVDEEPDERLEVADLVADVREARPALLAARGARRRRPARVAEAARRRRDDRVAGAREGLGVVAGVRRASALRNDRLRAAEAVEEQQRRERPVALRRAASRRRRSACRRSSGRAGRGWRSGRAVAVLRRALVAERGGGGVGGGGGEREERGRRGGEPRAGVGTRGTPWQTHAPCPSLPASLRRLVPDRVRDRRAAARGVGRARA